MLIKHQLSQLNRYFTSNFTNKVVSLSDVSMAVRDSNFTKWDLALQEAKNNLQAKLYYSEPYIKINTDVDKNITKQLLPWRKGPFAFNNFNLESEWNSSIKWRRLHNKVAIKNKKILDVGCNNGYFAMMFAIHGAKLVLGLEPYLLFNYQFNFIKNLSTNLSNVLLAPIRLEDIATKPYGIFDLVVSMGVLYHHKSPIEHLKQLKNMMISSGHLILETLIVDGVEGYSLTPKKRYANMPNVWFIPSILTLKNWLQRCGFGSIKILDDSITTNNEQRTTEFLGTNPQSLNNFVVNKRTIEGYPRPRRLMLLCMI